MESGPLDKAEAQLIARERILEKFEKLSSVFVEGTILQLQCFICVINVSHSLEVQ